jgi:hypothetical protein
MALILDGTSPTGAWSMYRDLLTSFVGGTRYTTATGVSLINDQTVASPNRNFGNAGTTAQPVVTTAGPMNRTCADFDGVNDALYTQVAALSSLIAAASGYIVVSFIADAITTSDATIYFNSTVIGDTGQYIGLHLKTPSTINSYNYDGTVDLSTLTITTATPYVVEWRHEGGNIYLRVNGGTEVSTASGNTSSLTSALWLGSSGGGYCGNIKFFEMATWSTVPALATRNAIVADFMAQHVAAPAGRAKVWNGSSWVVKPVKVWSGSAWVTKPVKVWNGSAWV